MTATITAQTETAPEGKVSFMRQELILDPIKAEAAKVALFGQGTVGSNAAMELARLGVTDLHLFDFDKFEAHNLPSQRADMRHLGMNKAEAVKQQLVDITNDKAARIKTTTQKVTGAGIVISGIAILGVDTMDSRKVIYEKIIQPQRDVTLMLDFRMKANLLQCYACDPRDERYATTLFTDEDADPGPCGGRTVSYTGALAGCLAANYVRKHIMGQPVPFFTGIDLDAMQLMRSEDE